MDTKRQPLFRVNSTAPIRICDNGGWTDTWFARHGKIFNIAVQPCAQVQIAVYSGGRADRIILHAENYSERYVVDPAKRWGKHPLLEATLAYMQIPDDLALEITIFSAAPGGASTGTSAAVTVALVGALAQLTPGTMTAHEVAYAAQRIDPEWLHQQCGIQDQLCSAYGGINYIEMFEYPHASVSPIRVSDATWWELERRLVLIYLGQSHRSSQIHELVIRALEDAGPDCKPLADLRGTAERSRDALCAGDFAALGRAMIENTRAQGRLHPALVSADAARVIEIARAYGALGWKVNGAGGEGGSLTLLCDARASAQRAMVRAIAQEHASYENIPIRLSRDGLRVWQTV